MIIEKIFNMGEVHNGFIWIMDISISIIITGIIAGIVIGIYYNIKFKKEKIKSELLS